MKYEFHVGDYVETKDGTIGYITETGVNYTLYFKWTSGGIEHFQELGQSVEEITRILSTLYNRVGQHDFTHPEELEKIQRLHETQPRITFRNEDGVFVDLGFMRNKINELIDAVNELRKGRS